MPSLLLDVNLAFEVTSAESLPPSSEVGPLSGFL
jgi:hypothetical protein